MGWRKNKEGSKKWCLQALSNKTVIPKIKVADYVSRLKTNPTNKQCLTTFRAALRYGRPL